MSEERATELLLSRGGFEDRSDILSADRIARGGLREISGKKFTCSRIPPSPPIFTFSEIERGIIKTHSVVIMAKIAEAHNVSIEELLK